MRAKPRVTARFKRGAPVDKLPPPPPPRESWPTQLLGSRGAISARSLDCYGPSPTAAAYYRAWRAALEKADPARLGWGRLQEPRRVSAKLTGAGLNEQFGTTLDQESVELRHHAEYERWFPRDTIEPRGHRRQSKGIPRSGA